MKETDTENLFVGNMGVADVPEPRGGGGGHTPAPRPVWVRGALRRHPEKQAKNSSAMPPFTSCGRIRGKGALCDVALNPQVSPPIDARMPWLPATASGRR
ncbi:hypothetical protein GCM10010448_18960 [Streptomyces glomeratus]|uniref:Uncharacterized protein n=1 Tax=Streptomyces glomeratus TaxID=284452 RepID=A0ABP6L9G9_9ACTN